LIVFVAGALGKHGAEDFDVGRHRGALAPEPRREALFEIAGGGVERVLEVPRVDVEEIAMGAAKPFPDIDDVEAGPRCELEGDLDRSNSHVSTC
jgi:hypothetical protein